MNELLRSVPKKKKLVAFITSNCPTSDRRDYVQELSKFIQVSSFAIKTITFQVKFLVRIDEFDMNVAYRSIPLVLENRLMPKTSRYL